ncbi:MAG TPA: hypothetical protein VLM38_07515 [Blastocatellia bacterium]|nr:hypothetical protein [Blastocatellia bacterium]
MSELERINPRFATKLMLMALEGEKPPTEREHVRRDPAKASTAANVMSHIAVGAGSATQRSSKGGKSGGGMGGQQAGGIKGGAKRKTHAGRR